MGFRGVEKRKERISDGSGKLGSYILILLNRWRPLGSSLLINQLMRPCNCTTQVDMDILLTDHINKVGTFQTHEQRSIGIGN